mmetsp:Transcript_19163/g.47876  ORF Transcript_19163/g.47876 Transcript_19163/m.47876 type:complete len:123 (-) Transcript_19163:113-481(-)
MSGLVSGTVTTAALTIKNEAKTVGTSVAYRFDTRDGTWQAAAQFQYSSHVLNLTVCFATASEPCAVNETQAVCQGISYVEEEDMMYEEPSLSPPLPVKAYSPPFPPPSSPPPPSPSPPPTEI